MIAGTDVNADSFTLRVFWDVLGKICPSAPQELRRVTAIKQRPLAVYNTFGQPTAVEEAMVGAAAAAAAAAFFGIVFDNDAEERSQSRTSNG
jgi:hypothetical protein